MQANLLRAAMAQQGINQAQLAGVIGVSPNTLSRKMNGKREFTVAEAQAITKALSLKEPQIIFFGCSSQMRNE